MSRRLLTPARRACMAVLGVIAVALLAAGGLVVLALISGVDTLVGGGPALH